jgi:cyclopropane-fatty-acyl-phospholipid synthase
MPHLLHHLVSTLGETAGTPFEVVLPDGERLRAGSGEPLFALEFKHRRALMATITRGHVGLLESYFDGDIDLHGDLGTALATGLRSGIDGHFGAVHALTNALHELGHSARAFAQAKDNARAHYGFGTDFYRQWLDEPLMMYTCAYWDETAKDLNTAQVHKVDHLCRKICLKDGDHVVDVGCGFGGFLLSVGARRDVKVTGVNTTPEQVAFLRGEIDRRGLNHRLNVREADMREVDGPYDKLVSIGVLEHAGKGHLDEVIRTHGEYLKPGGLGVIQFVGHVGHHQTDPFIRRHIFPGGWIPSLADVVVAMENAGLEVLDVENLRRHYALTLDAWAARFEAHWDTIRAQDPTRFDERFNRIWRTYLHGCAEMFRSPTGITHLFQVLFSRGNVDTRYPMTRRHVYVDDAPASSMHYDVVRPATPASAGHAPEPAPEPAPATRETA